ncbi:MAG TPA: hypothetical protein VMR45_05680, partial [Patescibacteria group bacterium]|nr:hypothetical protein [Patescibacteria group bacterium]
MKQQTVFRRVLANSVLVVGLVACIVVAPIAKVSAAASTTATTPFNAGAKVSFTFDEGYASAAEQAAP